MVSVTPVVSFLKNANKMMMSETVVCKLPFLDYLIQLESTFIDWAKLVYTVNRSRNQDYFNYYFVYLSQKVQIIILFHASFELIMLDQLNVYNDHCLEYLKTEEVAGNNFSIRT